MFRFNLIFIFSFISLTLTARAPAEELPESSEVPAIYFANSRWGVSLSYLSWQENLSVQNGSLKDYGTANFSGNELNLSYEFYSHAHPRHGVRLSGGIATGVTTAGGNLAYLTYQTSNVPWTLEEFSAAYAFQLSPNINLGVGALMMARQLSYPTWNGTSATSGQSTNIGYETELRVNLTDHWNLQFQLAGLSNNASTLWAFAIGYLF